MALLLKPYLMGLTNIMGSFSKNRKNSCRQEKTASPRIQSIPRSNNSSTLLKDGPRGHEAGPEKRALPRIRSVPMSSNSPRRLRGNEASPDRTHRKKAAAVFPVSEIMDIDIKKSINSSRLLKDRLRGREAGPDHTPRKKAAAVFPVSEIRDIDFEKQLSDESECSWLSPDCKSPSLLMSDESHYLWDCSLPDPFFPMLSLSGIAGGVSMFDGSKMSPIEEASLILDRSQEDTGWKHLQEKVAIWLHNIDGDLVTDSSHGCFESGDSSYETTLFEESSVFRSSCTSLSTYDGSPSPMDLEGENSGLIDSAEHGFYAMGSGLPSPSFKTRRNLLRSGSALVLQHHPISLLRMEHGGNHEGLSKHLLELEASHVQRLVVEGVPIEELVGLNEFDGHEGIDLEFDEDKSNLDFLFEHGQLTPIVASDSADRSKEEAVNQKVTD